MVLLLKPFLSSADSCRRWSSIERSTTCCRWRSRSSSSSSTSSATPEAGGARRRLSRLAQSGDRATSPGRLHVPGRRGPPLLRRHAGRAGPARLARHLLPLGVIEVSHFLGSIVGAGLLLVSQGLSRRLDGAYYLAVAGSGSASSRRSSKGGLEEAALLVVLLFVLWRARPAFDRQAALFDAPFSTGWIVAVFGTLGASVWLGLFAFKHVEYSSELWWQFELGRRLRASCARRWARPSHWPVRVQPAHGPRAARDRRPTDADLAGRSHHRRAAATLPYLVYLRDKALLFDEEREAFVMYGVQGRTWVALGDPVGPPDRLAELIRLFLERCDDFGGVPVFYEISKRPAPLRRFRPDVRQARRGGQSRPPTFSLEGARPASSARRSSGSRRTARRSGSSPPRRCRPSWTSCAPSPTTGSARRPAARRGSRSASSIGTTCTLPGRGRRARGAHRGVREPVAGARQARAVGRPDAVPQDAPKGVMEALFVHLMRWGKEQGYRWFSLGMAPLSGFEKSPVAPLWTRLALPVRARRGRLQLPGPAGIQGEVRPGMAASLPRLSRRPGLPRILADVAALIAGGYRKIFLR